LSVSYLARFFRAVEGRSSHVVSCPSLQPDRLGSGRLLGTISKRDVLAAFARDLIERRAAGGPTG